MDDDNYDFEKIEEQEKERNQAERRAEQRKAQLRAWDAEVAQERSPEPVPPPDHKCPHGHRLGTDIDETEDCNKCKAWQECALEYQIISGDVAPGTTLAKGSQPTLRPRIDKQQQKLCEGPFYNPLTYDCSRCRALEGCRDYLHLYQRIPRFIIDDFLFKLSPSAFKVFVFLNQRANFDPSSNHFGRCWPTDKQIEAATGVKSLKRCRLELQKNGLISFSWHRHGGDGGSKTSHIYTVSWILKQAIWRNK